MRILIFSLVFFPAVFLIFGAAFASEKSLNCDNRYLTLVNPVRGRDLWWDKSLSPLAGQYDAVKKGNYSATWLLQYDALKDEKLIGAIKKFDSKQEFGLFLEVSKDYADDSRVIYPYDAPWFYPRAVFLSGYKQSDRRKLVDHLFSKFKTSFGYYPKSVGAWWIDSYSLNYMKKKYEIKSAIIVADQKTTDNYGIWGQWWGVPYFPSKANILTPASNLENKQKVAVIQWAQRDPVLAYGPDLSYSNYSLQANDYIRQGKNTEYFKDLAYTYLDCQNTLGQITVGLETGIEGLEYLPEYKNQLEELKKIDGLQSVTMSGFADKFFAVYSDFPRQISLISNDSRWILTPEKRINQKLGDSVSYQPEISFSDYFLPDKSNFLDRRLPIENTSTKNFSIYPWNLLLTIFLLFLLSFRKRAVKIWLISSLFVFASFGLILKSHFIYGWEVYYGPIVKILGLTQVVLILTSFVLVWLFSKLKKFNLWLLPLVFGLDPLISVLRFTLVSGRYYFGIAADNLRFIGFSFIRPFQLRFENFDFPAYQAAALLKLNFDKIWNNLWLALFLYPIVHIFFALLLNHSLKRMPRAITKLVIFVLVLLLSWQLLNIYTIDPRIVIK